MNCSILHSSRGRLRVHLACGRMTLHEADVLEYYLRAVQGVTDVKVYDRTCDAVVEFEGERAPSSAPLRNSVLTATRRSSLYPSTPRAHLTVNLRISWSLPFCDARL